METGDGSATESTIESVVENKIDGGVQADNAPHPRNRGCRCGCLLLPALGPGKGFCDPVSANISAAHQARYPAIDLSEFDRVARHGEHNLERHGLDVYGNRCPLHLRSNDSL